MKLSDEQLDRLTQVAQQVLAPDRIGFDVRVHLSTGLVLDAVRAVVEAIPDDPFVRRDEWERWKVGHEKRFAELDEVVANMVVKNAEIS